MHDSYDIVIVGGGPGGTVAATSARQYYPDKSILMLRKSCSGYVPWGIPYMFSTMDHVEVCDDVGILAEAKIQMRVSGANEILRDQKKVVLDSGNLISYDKLVLATGSIATKLQIAGIEKLGIYTIRKDAQYLRSLKKDIGEANHIIVLGGGFIGIEFAEELAKISGKKITLIEAQKRVLANSFDKEFSDLVQEELQKVGVRVVTGSLVVSFEGDNRVRGVRLSSGEYLEAQVVVLGVGQIPNGFLAKQAGLETNVGGSIVVDEYQRTNDPSIFAVGDCAEKRDFFTRKRIRAMLASTATAEGRVAGANLYQIKLLKENRGTIATYSTPVGNIVLGIAGLTQQTALNEGFSILVGKATSFDHHPKTLPGSSKLTIKLVFAAQSGLLIGGQVVGGRSAAEITNMLGLAIQRGTTLHELETLQIATHPKLTAPPTLYPLIKAAENAGAEFHRIG